MAAAMPLRTAARAMVDLLWLAHEHACEVELANELDRVLQAGDLPDPDVLRTRFARSAQSVQPDIPIQIPTTGVYDRLLCAQGGTA